MYQYIKKFSEININDVGEVGGKNASLGEMFNTLSAKRVRIPDGFATTVSAFKFFLERNNLAAPINDLLAKLDRKSFNNLAATGHALRELILKASIPAELEKEIKDAYESLTLNRSRHVAVRSSATAEDLPNASFAGQHESFLNIEGDDSVINSMQKCFASLYTDRAIKYREDNHFDHQKVFLSAGVQLMVRSDKGSSGIGFTLDPDSGFRNIIHLSGTWGLGENIVQGNITPDEFIVFKPTFLEGKKAIIRKKTGAKELTMIFGAYEHGQATINIPTLPEKRRQFVLSDHEINQLARWAIDIEDHYRHPVDFEWAKDGIDNQLYIVQARPETVHSVKKTNILTTYDITKKSNLLVQGEAVGTKIATGIARVLHSTKEIDKLSPGEILVTELTSPDWDPVMKKAAAVVTNKGGRTSHAAIVARELGVPAVVGTDKATTSIKDGSLISVSCCEGETGFVYDGVVEYTSTETDLTSIKLPESTDALLIVSDPDKAFHQSFLPNHGVGLLRIEFIIMHLTRIHPMAIAHFDELKNEETRKKIEFITDTYESKEEYFIQKLTEGIATIAAAFYPKDVIVRLSDFKSNEYAQLLGGDQFELKEENPMIGFRGASRYYNDRYKDGFRLECLAIKKLRQEMGFTNIKVMIPFCRTVEEGRKVIETMREFGLDRRTDASLEIFLMIEIPSNVLLASKFAKDFDGFSIGSNDLTQLTLGIDRDSEVLSDLFDEQNEAVESMISIVIEKAKYSGVRVGLCGQAPSDIPEFASFLVEQDIDSISFTPDSILKGIQNMVYAEETGKILSKTMK